MADQGALSDLVRAGGYVMAAGGAGLAWAGTGHTDLDDQAPRAHHLAAVVAGVAMALVWSAYGDGDEVGSLTPLVIGALAVAVGAFLALRALEMQLTEERVVVQDGAGHRVPVLGGFRLTPQARRAVEEGPRTRAEVFAGMAYVPARMWTAGSLTLARTCYLSLGVLLTGAVTVAVSSAGMLLLGLGS